MTTALEAWLKWLRIGMGQWEVLGSSSKVYQEKKNSKIKSVNTDKNLHLSSEWGKSTHAYQLAFHD